MVFLDPIDPSLLSAHTLSCSIQILHTGDGSLHSAMNVYKCIYFLVLVLVSECTVCIDAYVYECVCMSECVHVCSSVYDLYSTNCIIVCTPTL